MGRVSFFKILVVIFSDPEFLKRHYLGCNFRIQLFAQSRFFLLNDLPLSLILIKDDGTVLRTPVRPLHIDLGRVLGAQINIDQ